MAKKTVESNKDFMATSLLSFLFGYLGVDRFYLGYTGLGVLKLVTLGGFGIWYWVDLILILTGAMKDKKGLPLANRQQKLKPTLIIIGVIYACMAVAYIWAGTSHPELNGSNSDVDKLQQSVHDLN